MLGGVACTLIIVRPFAAQSCNVEIEPLNVRQSQNIFGRFFRKSMVCNVIVGFSEFLSSENFGLYGNLLFSVCTYQQTTIHFLHTALPLAHSCGGIISHAGIMICANNTSLSCDKPVCDTYCLSYLSDGL